MLTAYNAASFGRYEGHFETAYAEPVQRLAGHWRIREWEIEGAIKRKAFNCERGGASDGHQLESTGDITGEIAAIHARN